jgi:DNA-directed RNA polymerase alpha subunit
VREVLERFGLSLLGEGLPPATPDLIVQFKLFLTAPSEYTHFKLAVLDLCLNIANQLRVAGFVTVRDLLDTNRHALSRQHGFTSSMISEIEERIELYGLALQPSPKIVTKTGAIHHVLTR